MQVDTKQSENLGNRSRVIEEYYFRFVSTMRIITFQINPSFAPF